MIRQVLKVTFSYNMYVSNFYECTRIAFEQSLWFWGYILLLNYFCCVCSMSVSSFSKYIYSLVYIFSFFSFQSGALTFIKVGNYHKILMLFSDTSDYFIFLISHCVICSMHICKNSSKLSISDCQLHISMKDVGVIKNECGFKWWNVTKMCCAKPLTRKYACWHTISLKAITWNCFIFLKNSFILFT